MLAIGTEQNGTEIFSAKAIRKDYNRCVILQSLYKLIQLGKDDQLQENPKPS